MDSKRDPNGRPRPPGPESARRPSDHPPKEPRSPFASWPWVLLLIFLAVNYFVAPIVVPDTSDRVTIPYTAFKEQVAGRQRLRDHHARRRDPGRPSRRPITCAGDRREPEDLHRESSTPASPLVRRPGLEPLLEPQGVVINARPLDEGGAWLADPAARASGRRLLIFGLLIWLFSAGGQRPGAASFGIGRSRAKRYDAGRACRRITFADVAGIDEAEDELDRDRRLPEEPGEVPAARRHASPRACCWSARRAPARRCWRGRSPARPTCRSSA